ncbi:MAG: hypothetical protein ACXWV5_04135 [Flavitalea sp.]
MKYFCLILLTIAINGCSTTRKNSEATFESTQYHIMLMNWQTLESKQLTDTTFKYQYAPVFVRK